MTMKLALEKLNLIEEAVTETRIDVAKIQEHLKQINGTVKWHTEDLKCADDDIHKLRNDQVKLATLVGVIVTVLTITANFFISKLL